MSAIVGLGTSIIVWSSAFCTVKYSMYEGPTRNATSATTMMTTVVNRNPVIDNPCCFPAMLPLPVTPSAYAAPHALECKRRDVVPVEPDEKRAAADVIVRHEAPIAAVVAIVAVVAHHEVVTRRHPALEAALIVVAIFAPGKRPHVRRIHRLRLCVDADRVSAARLAVGALDAALERFEPQPFEVAVRGIGLLRPRRAVDGQPLVAIFDDVTAHADDALDEVLRRVQRVAEHDDVAAPGIADRNHLLFDDRKPDPVDELVDQDEVADLQRRTHRRRRYLERLGEERPQQEYDEQYGKERFRVLDPDGLARALGAIAGECDAIDQPDDARHGGQREQDQGKVHL